MTDGNEHIDPTQIKISPAGKALNRPDVTDEQAQDLLKCLGESLDAFYKAFIIMRANREKPHYPKAAAVTLKTMKALLESIE